MVTGDESGRQPLCSSKGDNCVTVMKEVNVTCDYLITSIVPEVRCVSGLIM